MGDTVTFDDIARQVRDIVHPDEVPNLPYVGLEHIEQGSLRLNGWSKSSQATSTKFRFKKGDILFGKLRPYFRKVVRAPFDGVCSTDIWVVRAKPGTDQGYLFYWMASPDFVDFASKGSEGTRMPRAKWEHVSRFTRTKLDLDEQRAIAHILGTLDDKIELNRRMNETLEEIAKAIFKSWFVNFDPVIDNALKAGNPIPDALAEKAARRRAILEKLEKEAPNLPKLSPEIARLFPDSFEDSSLGPIPKGWKIEKLGQIADVNWGDTSTTKKAYVSSGYLAYSATGPDGFLPYYDYDRTAVVLSAIGVNAGMTWLARGKWSCIKNTIRFWATDERISTEYLYFFTLGKEKWPIRGSAQPFISQGDARNLSIIVPDNSLGKLFGNVIAPYLNRIGQNKKEISILSSIRDTLLPKLISGQICIKDAVEYIL